MKRTTLLLAFMLICLAVFSRPRISNISAPTQVGVYDLYEISFTMNEYTNPYDPKVIDIYAIFHSPTGQTFHVNAFYFEDYVFSNSTGYEVADSTGTKGWKIRFTPNCAGSWTYTIHAQDAQMSAATTTRQFTCTQKNMATGFISKANNRFLKQTKVVKNHEEDDLYFPAGPDIAWYACADSGHFRQPFGIYDYINYINKLSGNGNYFRIFINRYPFLSLYGKEFTTGEVFFNNTINQKDSKELDLIIEYAKSHGISVMPCIFPHSDFVSWDFYKDTPDDWTTNPFHTSLGIDYPCDFFISDDATKITKNLFRYIVARWGYATNIVAWELWNEANQMEKDTFYFGEGGNMCDQDPFRENLIAWHSSMSQYIKTIDPFHHLVTTSTTTTTQNPDPDHPENPIFFHEINSLDCIDFAQIHRYKSCKTDGDNFHDDLYYCMDNIHNGIQFVSNNNTITLDPIDKPSFVGEFGFNYLGKETDPHNEDEGWHNDPWGIELHNTLWSGSFSAAMGVPSIWWWQYIFNSSTNLYTYFKPINQFFTSLPIPSKTFYPKSNKTDGTFPNGIETYYMMNFKQDTIYGWAHDEGFRYQKIRLNNPDYLTTLNSSYRPSPSSDSNTISINISNQPIGSQYIIKWFNSDTGALIQTDLAYVTDRDSHKVLSFEFPSRIRDIRNHRINNKFGDVVFAIYLDCDKSIWREGNLLSKDLNNIGDEIVCDKSTSQVFFKTNDNKINYIWWNENANCWQHANLNNAGTNVKKCLAIADNGSRIFYVSIDDNINSIYYNYSTRQWVHDNMNNASQGNVAGPIAVNNNNQVFYRHKNGSLNALWYNSQTNQWTWSSLNNSASSGVGDAIAVSPNKSQVFYKTTSGGLKAIEYNQNTSQWVAMSINDCANSGIKGPITITPNNQVFFRTTGNAINNIYYNGSIWQRSQLNNSATNVSSKSGKILQADVVGKVFYINDNDQVDCIYWTPDYEWRKCSMPQVESGGRKINISSLATNYDGNVYFLTAKSKTGLNKPQIYRFFYKSQCFYESSTHIREQRDETNNDYKLIEATTDSMVTDPDNSASSHLPSVNIYPNPCSNNITISSDDEIEKVSIFDCAGSFVSSYDNIHSNTIIIDLSSYRNGLYIIKTQNQNGYTSVNKISKKS